MDFNNNVMDVLIEIFKAFNQEISTINLKLTSRGQVDYVTGTLNPGIKMSLDRDVIEKVYRKKVVPRDYRFCNTTLYFDSENKFVITSK